MFQVSRQIAFAKFHPEVKFWHQVGDDLPAKCIGGTFTLMLKDLKVDLIGTYVSACEFVRCWHLLY